MLVSTLLSQQLHAPSLLQLHQRLTDYHSLHARLSMQARSFPGLVLVVLDPPHWVARPEFLSACELLHLRSLALTFHLQAE